MSRVVIVGAGGMVFPLRLAGDLLATPALAGTELVLYDLSLERAGRTERAVRDVAAHHGLPVNVHATDDARAALTGARYVILTFQVGGLTAYRADIEIPRKYGIDCVAGDTMNPGGILRFLRSVPAFDALAAVIRDVCPDALVLNYANPMAMNVLYLAGLGLNVVGLCHSIPGTADLLADLLGVSRGELEYRAAGINHQSWFVRLHHEGRDLNPRLRQVLRERFLPRFGGTTPWTEGGPTYVGGQERVRAELLETFGYFTSESSHHGSEYVPYFRRGARTKTHLVRRWDYYRGSILTAGREEESTREAVASLQRDLTRSAEYAPRIIEAMETGTSTRVYGNVPNTGLIDNLPADACVEVECAVDALGVRPEPFGRLPARCAGLNLTNVAAQVAAVEAARLGSREALDAAFALDPLTASILDLEDIRLMVRELLEAQAAYLPDWAREGHAPVRT